MAEHCFAWAEREGWAEGFMALGGNKVRFLGHGIGLAIDEYPVIAKGFDAPLEEGMTFALEPKLGIPGFGMVGVENTFEVTPGGGRCLSGEKFEIISVEG
jgi:Xaa-Pro aminopeptidase